MQKPIFALAPMADVTDAAFRRLIAKYGKPDVMWTEFVSADGLARAPEEPARTADGHRSGGGRKKLLLDLIYTEAERPIVAQFFTSTPENMKKAALLAVELGFDGIDINMGCPDKTVEKQGAGAALMKNPKLAREVLRAAKDGAKGLPISVKTRIGFNKPELEGWLPEILKEEPAVVTVHARTRKEMSKVPARWEFVKRAVEIRDEMKSPALILGNGDVKDLAEARRRLEETGCDGVMLGRAIFGNPWLFSRGERSDLGNLKRSDLKERLNVLVEHAKLFEELLACPAEASAKGEACKNFAIMKKHFKAYVNGFDGASELRAELMETENASQVEEIINDFLI